MKDLNQDIVDLADEDEHFAEVAPKLFGVDFEKTMKKRAESMKLLKASKKAEERKNVFSIVRPPSSSEGWQVL